MLGSLLTLDVDQQLPCAALAFEKAPLTEPGLFVDHGDSGDRATVVCSHHPPFAEHQWFATQTNSREYEREAERK
jgi:hypothetical protein